MNAPSVWEVATAVREDAVNTGSVADWMRRLHEERRQLHPSPRQDLSRQYEPYRQRYRQGALRLRQSLQCGFLAQPDLAALTELSQQTLQLSHFIYDELCHVDLADQPIVPAETLAGLLDGWESRIARLDRHVWLVEQTHSCAEDLHAVVDELLHATVVPRLRLQRLTDRLRTEVSQQPEIHALLPEAGLSLCGSLEREHWNDAWFYVDALQTARLMVWLLHRPARWQDRLEPLVMAALLHDCGLLARRNAPASPRHPELGAALLGSITQLPTDVPLLVALHHERLDGSGLPRALRGRDLSPAARLLTLIVRFHELIEATRQTPSNEQPWFLPATVQLARETRQGEFDPALLDLLLNALDAELPAVVESRLKSARSVRMDQAHGMPRPHQRRSSATQIFDPGAQETKAYHLRSRSGRRRILIPRGQTQGQS